MLRVCSLTLAAPLIALPLATWETEPVLTDAELLLAFKSSFSNGEKVLTSWSGVEPCGGQWLGITCTDGLVTTIDLSGRTLEGAIPATGWQLPASLEGLNLNNNAIRSVLPATWQLPALRRLELGGNKLHGPIPATLSLPPQLKHLQLCCNELSGTLPASLALPTTLFELDLDNNMLSGSVPAEWQLPSGLFLLNLQQNALQGSLPAWPDLHNLNVAIQPGNPQMCGEVPVAPKYGTWKANTTPYPPAEFSPCSEGILSQLLSGTSNNGDFIGTWCAAVICLVAAGFLSRRMLQRWKPTMRRSLQRFLRTSKASH
ncbi:hypothetical protein N2152v2_003231 [Parachlorella kessleri]